MATLPSARCSCGRYLRRRPEGHDDYAEQERSYFHEYEECDCGGDVRSMHDRGPAPTRVARRERSRSSAVKQKTYLRKHVCACSPPRILRAAARDLTDVTCGRCQSYFVWSPSPAELSDDELAGRMPA